MVKRRENKSSLKKIWCAVILIIALELLISGLLLILMERDEKRTVKAEKERSSIIEEAETVGQKWEYLEEEESNRHGGSSTDLLILVNKTHEMPRNRIPELVKLRDWDIQAARVLYEDLRMMLRDGRNAGGRFVISSGYRDREYQEKLLLEDIRKDMAGGMSYAEAYKKETKETMPPGYSEHETGLALDIVSASYQKLDERQEQTHEAEWLRENSYKYGFILRYPKEKADITGISYEPWHFRYVGREAARYMYENGLTLEEYHMELDSDKKEYTNRMGSAD